MTLIKIIVILLNQPKLKGGEGFGEDIRLFIVGGEECGQASRSVHLINGSILTGIVEAMTSDGAEFTLVIPHEEEKMKERVLTIKTSAVICMPNDRFKTVQLG